MAEKRAVSVRPKLNIHFEHLWESMRNKGHGLQIVGGGGLIQRGRNLKFSSLLCLRKLELLSPILECF